MAAPRGRRGRLEPNGDSFELCGGLHLSTVGTTRPPRVVGVNGFGMRLQVEGKRGGGNGRGYPPSAARLYRLGLAPSVNCCSSSCASLITAVMDLMVAGSSCHRLPSLGQALRLSKPTAAASCSNSARADSRSSNCPGLGSKVGSGSFATVASGAAVDEEPPRLNGLLLFRKFRNPIAYLS